MTTDEIMKLADEYASLRASGAISDNLRLAETLEGEARIALQSAIEALQADAARMREALEKIAAQHSGEVASRKLSDCMAAIASLALRSNGT